MITKCNKCGGLLQYNPGTTYLQCSYCSNKEFIQHDKQIALHPVNEQNHAYTVHNAVKCNGCGAEILLSNFIIQNCPYCTQIISNKASFENKAFSFDGIIPFKIDIKQAHYNIRKWKKNLFLTPDDFKKQLLDFSLLKGVYVPYWLIYFQTNVSFQARCGTKSLNSNKVFYSIEKGEFDTTIQHLAIIATSSIPQNIKDKTMPNFDEVVSEPFNNRWNFNDLIPFNEAFLLGFSAQTPQKTIKEILALNDKKINYEIEQIVIRNLEKSGYDFVHVKKLNYKHDALNYRLVLLPMWIGAYYYQGHLFQILVNGQTGEVIGERPISKTKVAIMWILIILIVIYGMFIIALQNYVLWAIHIVLIGIAVYLKEKKEKNLIKENEAKNI